MSIEKEQVSCHKSIATPRSQPSAAREETVPSGEKHFAAPQGWNPGWVPWFGGSAQCRIYHYRERIAMTLAMAVHIPSNDHIGLAFSSRG